MFVTHEEQSAASCVFQDGDHPVSAVMFAALNLGKPEYAVKENNLCFCCLKSGHRVHECQLRKSCGVGSCQKKHHKSVHAEKQVFVKSSFYQCQMQILLQMLPVTLQGPRFREQLVL